MAEEVQPDANLCALIGQSAVLWSIAVLSPRGIRQLDLHLVAASQLARAPAGSPKDLLL